MGHFHFGAGEGFIYRAPFSTFARRDFCDTSRAIRYFCARSGNQFLSYFIFSYILIFVRYAHFCEKPRVFNMSKLSPPGCQTEKTLGPTEVLKNPLRDKIQKAH